MQIKEIIIILRVVSRIMMEEFLTIMITAEQQ